MPKIAILVEYDGEKFHGFQRQKSLVSVQQCIESALEIVLREKITIEGAGRTDTGVHAKGMIISFYTSNLPQNFHRFIVSINGLTNQAIVALAAAEVNESFHARFSCTEREYEYYVLNTRFPHPLFSGRVYWEKCKLNLEIIKNEIKSLIGKHDFTSLTNKSYNPKESTEREIKNAEVIEIPEVNGLFKIQIRSNGFLYNMVRVIAGTLIDIGKGVLETRNMEEIIRSKNRKQAGITLPPTGLYFLRAYYKDYPEISDLYNKSWSVPVI
ncbi:MAG: tRNA pseudouridine(38-40) synthase TruA [Leptospiraceae bacterium]|nr:tRNA pseudouridine(38-40) synthase TruA [Leptospiraceae bacterium]MCP5497223.1 tRNA pseudouridine(38-40) synthase TruA [Leptospiraceae bacterium]